MFDVIPQRTRSTGPTFCRCPSGWQVSVDMRRDDAPSGASSSMSSVSRFRGVGSRGKRNPSHAFIGSRKGFRPSYFGVFGALPGSPCQLSAVGPTACPFSHIGESEGKKETARLHGRLLWSRVRDAISSHRSRSICSRHMSGSRNDRRRGFPLGPSWFRRRALRGSAPFRSRYSSRWL